MIVGLTGVFGSGKSTVLGIFGRLGAAVLSSDEIVHELLRTEAVGTAVRGLFGGKALSPDGAVDRARLASLVFSSPGARKRLEALIHPLVDRRISEEAAKTAPGKLLVVEVPLLFESGLEHRFDRVICVSASRETIIARLEKKGFARREIMRRLRAQWTQAEKEARSDLVIFNDGDLSGTEKQVSAFLAALPGAKG